MCKGRGGFWRGDGRGRRAQQALTARGRRGGVREEGPWWGLAGRCRASTPRAAEGAGAGSGAGHVQAQGGGGGVRG